MFSIFLCAFSLAFISQFLTWVWWKIIVNLTLCSDHFAPLRGVYTVRGCFKYLLFKISRIRNHLTCSKTFPVIIGMVLGQIRNLLQLGVGWGWGRVGCVSSPVGKATNLCPVDLRSVPISDTLGI